MAQSITPDKLFNLFYKYPVNHIPIVKDGAIKGYISRDKTLRQANKASFFDVAIEVNLKNILGDAVNGDFFQELDDQGVRQIPLVDSTDLSVKVFSISQFNSVYRPADMVEKGDFEKLVSEMDVPVLVFNSRGGMIYKNKRTRYLLSLMADAAGEKRSTLLDYLPDSFFEEISTAKAHEMLSFRVSRKPFPCRSRMVEMERGTVFVVTFLC